MPIEKKELMLYASEYEEYEATLAGKNPDSSAGKSSKSKTRNALANFMKILSQHGRTWPDASDYEEYKAGKPDNETTRQNESRVKKFFAWLEKRKETITMTENEVIDVKETTQPISFGADDETSTEITATIKPESFGAAEAVKPEPRKRGRKSGEKKMPVSVYLDGETYRVMNILSDLTHRSIGEIAANTLSEFAKKNAAKVDAKATEVQAALDAVKKAMENFTLDY